MAGKSTLLRAIGVNAALAQAIGLVAADSWSSRPVEIITAMAAQGVVQTTNAIALLERAGSPPRSSPRPDGSRPCMVGPPNR